MCKPLVFTFGLTPFYVTKLIEHSESRTSSSIFFEEVAEGEEPSVEKWPWSAGCGEASTLFSRGRSFLVFR